MPRTLTLTIPATAADTLALLRALADQLAAMEAAVRALPPCAEANTSALEYYPPPPEEVQS